MALLRSGSAPMISRGGRPLLGAQADLVDPGTGSGGGTTTPPPAAGLVEPAAPAGWGEVFWDAFSGTTLDAAKWQIKFGGSASANGALTWDHAGVIVNNGLTLRAWKAADGTWRGGGIMQGHTATGFAGYGDFQASVKCRFPAGQGVGAYAVAWPQNNAPPPEFNFIQTPTKAKSQIRATWNWVGNVAGASSTFTVDATQNHIYTIRRTNGRWNYWVDGVEQAVNSEWASHQSTLAMVIGLASFVATASDAYGGAPDTTTPSPYNAHVSWVRVVAPGGGAITPIPTDPPPVTEPEPGTGATAAPPSNWPLVFDDQFTRPATFGIEALDGAKWSVRSYGGDAAHNGSSFWDNANGLESTGSTIRVHTTYRDGAWRCDGFQQGGGDKPGYGEFHVRFRARYSHLHAPGVGGYALMWPASNDWSSEIDILEMPGTEKNRAQATLHADQTGDYNLGAEGHNNQATIESSVDLSQWHIWDCRRTYRTVNGDVLATIKVWIDGNPMPDNSFFVDNSFADENMVFGAATFVPPNWAYNWYSPPDNTTPTDSYFELDYVSIWSPNGTPVQGSQAITINNSPGTLTAASAGALVNWTANLSITGVSTVEWAVHSSAGTAYTTWQSLAVSGNPMQHTIQFRANADRVRYRKPGDATSEVASDPVTIVVAGSEPTIESVTTTSALTVDAGTEVPHTITTRNMSSVGWVRVGGQSTGYAWQTQPVYAATNGSLNISPAINNSGEFIKAVPPEGSTVPAKDGPSFTVVGTVDPVISDDAAAAKAFVAPLTSGMNIERGSPWNFSYDGKALNAGVAYYTYLKGLGLTHVRFFYPYRPDQDMEGNGITGDNTPQNSHIDRMLDACSWAINAGLKVFVDMTDVVEDYELAEHWTAVKAYIDRFAIRAAGRSALTTSMFCLGPFNELAQRENPSFNSYRLEAHNIIRARLPNHVLMTSGSYWGNPDYLVKSDWAMVSDKRVVAQWHIYDHDITQARLTDQRNYLDAFQSRNGGIPTIGGEVGYGNHGWPDPGTGLEIPTQNGNLAKWVTNQGLYSRYLGMERPIWWCITKGTWWQANRSASDPRLRPELEQACRDSDATIRGLQAWKDQNPA